MTLKDVPVPDEPYLAIVDFLHTDEHPFCGDVTCPCHDDQELWAELGDALAEGRVKDQDAGRVWAGELSIRPRVA